MSTAIDYFFTVVSPWSYLGDARLRQITERYDVNLTHKPVNTPTIFSRTGGLQLKERSDQRKAYRMQELNRWRDSPSVPDLDVLATISGASVGDEMSLAASRYDK